MKKEPNVKEIRKFGDGETVVLYTNIPELELVLQTDAELLKSIPYSKGGVIMGQDYYFLQGYRKTLERLIRDYD